MRNLKYSLLSLWLFWIPAFVAQVYYISTHRCSSQSRFTIFLNSTGVLFFYPLLLPIISLIYLWRRDQKHWEVVSESENSKDEEMIETISYKVNLYLTMITKNHSQLILEANNPFKMTNLLLYQVINNTSKNHTDKRFVKQCEKENPSIVFMDLAHYPIKIKR